VSSFSNAPESEALSLEEVTVFENARQAVVTLKKTFEMWLVIAKSVVLARRMAERRGGRKTFMRIIEQQGLGKIVNKATASRLEKIMEPENLPGIIAWHQTLTDKQQIDWAAPTTIFKRCPVFAKPKVAKQEGEKPLSRAEKAEQALAVALEENHKLKQREDGDRFKPTDTAEDIATVLVGMFSSTKAADIARRILSKLKAPRRGKVAAE
jgi:hypothetical protein